VDSTCDRCPALAGLAIAGRRSGRRPALRYPSASVLGVIERAQAAARQAAKRTPQRDDRLTDPKAVRRPVQRHRVARPNPNYGFGPVPDAGPVVIRHKGEPVPAELPPRAAESHTDPETSGTCCVCCGRMSGSTTSTARIRGSRMSGRSSHCPIRSPIQTNSPN
jgi:hypothetical protein